MKIRGWMSKDGSLYWTETRRTIIPEQPVRYGEVTYHYGSAHHKEGIRTGKIRTRLHNFKVKIEGKRYVDGVFVSDWVRYE